MIDFICFVHVSFEAAWVCVFAPEVYCCEVFNASMYG